MSIFDDYDIQLDRVENLVLKNNIIDFLYRYCSADTVYPMKYDPESNSSSWFEKELRFITNEKHMRRFDICNRFQLVWDDNNGWLIRCLSDRFIAIRGLVGDIPDYIKFISRKKNIRKVILLINCVKTSHYIVDVDNMGYKFWEITAKRYF